MLYILAACIFLLIIIKMQASYARDSHIEKQMGDSDEEAWLTTQDFSHPHIYRTEGTRIHKVLHE